MNIYLAASGLNVHLDFYDAPDDPLFRSSEKPRGTLWHANDPWLQEYIHTGPMSAIVYAPSLLLLIAAYRAKLVIKS